jgi:hypothetical protein
LEANPEKINWIALSQNSAALHLLEKNPDKICWRLLSSNSAAIDLLKANPTRIDWSECSSNEAIFTYDYVAMKHNHIELKIELMQKMWHPSRISDWLENGFDIENL